MLGTLTEEWEGIPAGATLCTDHLQARLDELVWIDEARFRHLVKEGLVDEIQERPESAPKPPQPPEPTLEEAILGEGEAQGAPDETLDETLLGEDEP